MQTSKRNYEKKILRLEDEIETQRQVLSTGLYLFVKERVRYYWFIFYMYIVYLPSNFGGRM